MKKHGFIAVKQMHTKKWVPECYRIPYKNIPTEIIHVENIYFTTAVLGPPYDVGYRVPQEKTNVRQYISGKNDGYGYKSKTQKLYK